MFVVQEELFMPNKFWKVKTSAYKFNIHKFPRIFALLSGSKTEILSY